MRYILLLLCASGCDLVIPLTEPSPAPCGPYATVTAVAFDAALEDPSDFSIAYDGVHGMVRARVHVPSNPTATFTGPVPIVDNAGTWTLDTTRFTGINTFGLTGGHILGDGTVFGWIDHVASGTLPKLDRYRFVNQWGIDGAPESSMLETDFSKNLRPGNEIVLPVDGGQLRFFVEIKADYDDPTKRKQIVIRQKFVGDPWINTAQADKIANTERLDPSAAVMNLEHDVLVYAARESGGKSRLWAANRNKQKDEFEIGSPIPLDAEDDLDDTEPWIAQSCGTLYFRRGGITYKAE